MKLLLASLLILGAVACGDNPVAPTPTADVHFVPDKQPATPSLEWVGQPFCATYPHYDWCVSYCADHPGLCP